MGTATRKQREVQQRELLLLDIGRRMLIEQGFAGLSMDRLAEATEYSKGTIYQHFSTKEDLVAALATQSMERRFALFDRASRFVGCPRERLAAIQTADELFVRLHPHYSRCEMVIKMANLHDRASSDRLATLDRLDACCSNLVGDLIGQAVAAGDLTLTPPRTAEEMFFGLLSLVIGGHNIMLNHGAMLHDLRIADPFPALRRTFDTMLDGYGMHPLASVWDYEATRTRALQEIFADECHTAGLD